MVNDELILSGINHGANVGDFISLSGTLGAAFAAASQGIRAIAISQHFTEPNPVKFSAVEHYFPKIAKRLLSFDWPENVCMNVNFPEAAIGDIAGIRIASQAHLSIDWKVYKKNDPVNHPYYWIQADYQDKQKFPNSDVQLIEHSNIITITAMQSRQEYTECWEKLEELFSSNV